MVKFSGILVSPKIKCCLQDPFLYVSDAQCHYVYQQIFFEAATGTTSQSDIAIDDITFIDGKPMINYFLQVN